MQLLEPYNSMIEGPHNQDTRDRVDVVILSSRTLKKEDKTIIFLWRSL